MVLGSPPGSSEVDAVGPSIARVTSAAMPGRVPLSVSGSSTLSMAPAAVAKVTGYPDAITRGGLRGWAARRPVASFLILLFSLAYPIMSLPVLAAHGVIPDGWMPQLPGLDTERIAAAMLVLLALLPTTFLVTWAADGGPGVLRLVRRMPVYSILHNFGGWGVLARAHSEWARGVWPAPTKEAAGPLGRRVVVDAHHHPMFASFGRRRRRYPDVCRSGGGGGESVSVGVGPSVVGGLRARGGQQHRAWVPLASCRRPAARSRTVLTDSPVSSAIVRYP